MKPREIEVLLRSLGFIDNSIVETILVTKNKDGSYNAAPMGVIYSDNRLEVRTFTSSKTFENLLWNECVSFNVTNDPLLFLNTAFKKDLKGLKITDWGIENADAVIYAMKVSEDNMLENRVSFSFEPTEIIVKRDAPSVFSRGRSAAVEAIIHATRVKAFQFDEKEHRVNELLIRIDQCFEIISRTSGASSAEVKVVEELKNLFKKWGIKS